MTADDWADFILALPGVQTARNFGYRFFFTSDDHRLPFATIADADNEYEKVSKLDRAGVFRLNIGVRRATFDALFPRGTPADIDYAALDVVMPHPDYAKQAFICVLCPAGANIERVKGFVREAYDKQREDKGQA